ncbi:MAG: hypothetical protein JWR25_1330 [Noviherbaspirillum sp.]|nr:hypothetical protein [Noviherbaspirillum sp.]
MKNTSVLIQLVANDTERDSLSYAIGSPIKGLAS